QYVWKDGDLATAIRASMAIPIVFSPIVRDSMVLYDGGVYNNFPWRDMEREFKPDFIIGGRCVAGSSPNIRTLTGQIELMVMQATDYNIPSEKGLVIGRNVDVGVLDFSTPLTTIEQGYADAISMMDSIRHRVARRAPHEVVERRRLEYKSTLPTLEFSGRSVEALDNIKVPTKKERIVTGDTLFIDTSKPKNKGKLNENEYSFAAFKNIFYRTMLDREMKSGFPKAQYNPSTGLFDLEVKMSSVPIFKLRGGLNISSSSINQAYLGFIYQDNRRNRGVYAVDGYLGSFYNSAVLSTRHNFYERKTPFYLKNSITYNYTDYARANNQKITFNSLFKEGNYVSNEIYWSTSLGVKVGTTVCCR
ncbi:MAG: patatin-like phospholipase family protein, partial [Rikenellaceae bacterium]